jgi:hypothetical protein
MYFQHAIINRKNLQKAFNLTYQWDSLTTWYLVKIFTFCLIFKDDIQNHIEKYNKEWVPAEFLVKEIYLISRLSSDVPYEVRKVIPLGTEISAPLRPTIPYQKNQ